MISQSSKVYTRLLKPLTEILERHKASSEQSPELSEEVARYLADVVDRKKDFLRGLVSLLEMLYELLGHKADLESKTVLDEIINIVYEKIDLEKALEESRRAKKQPVPASAAPQLPSLTAAAPHERQPVSNLRREERPNQPLQQEPVQAPPEDDWTQPLRVTMYAAEDLRRERQANPDDKKYLTIQDICPDYQYDYAEEFDEALFDRIEEKFRGCRLVGVDVECHLRKEKATYMQLSTDSYGIIFNIRSLQLREHQRMKDFMRRLLETTETKKVGHSLSHDRKMIKQAFFGDIEFSGNLSLEDIFFTAPLKTNTLGLSSMCLRAFGFPLNKDLQSHIGEQESLFCDEEKEYAILDALAPVVLYNRYEKAINTKIPATKFVVNCQDRQAVRRDRVLIDHNLELVRVYFLQKNIEFEILKDKTYQGSRP